MAGRRRGTDEAGISKLPDGRYRVRVTTRGPKGKPVEADRRVDTYEEAVSLRASLRAQMEQAGEAKRPKRPPTVEGCADTFLELRRAEGRSADTTIASAVYCLERVCAQIGALRLDELRRSDLRELCAQLERDWSPRTARLTWAYAMMCLREAWAEWGLPDITAGIKGPQPPEDRAGRVLEAAEVTALLELARTRPAPQYELLLVALTTGLRRTELFSLERAQLHLDAPQPHLVVTVSKTRAGRGRAVPLAPLVVEVLRAWLEVAPLSPWLFPRIRQPQQPYEGATFYAQLIAMTKQLGLEHVTPHDLRRTFLTNLQAAQVDATLRMMLAGHASVKEQTPYLRPTTATLAGAAAGAWRVIEGGLGNGSGDGAGQGGKSPEKTTA